MHQKALGLCSNNMAFNNAAEKATVGLGAAIVDVLAYFDYIEFSVIAHRFHYDNKKTGEDYVISSQIVRHLNFGMVLFDR
jgi:hypothetical protein